ncbi:MAG: TPM domain-containing protein [Candidatus Pseudobacter hemicellulosilyticus]|uniref:TPM domain-containing protein n=1 Tax=Candidatus Pseudobacter hemicellulosilyticus TaxID=3121375 RepID=A0AAJ5WR98_9BACT|nr:MAG: TPM domain-containing protein [Pseudobacter sp.]
MKHLLFVFSCLLIVTVTRAQDIDAIIRNKPKTLVNDYANVIPDDEQQALENLLVAFDDSTSNQIAVVTVKTLGGRALEETALAIYRSWGIGNKKTNNGVLILAAIDDRQIRIEVGYGLEGAIPDITANQIIRNDIAPEFRSENYAAGFRKAAHSLIQAAAGEYTAPKEYDQRKKQGRGTIGSIFTFIVILVIVLAISRGGGGGGGGMMSRRGSVWGPPIIFPGVGGFGGGGGGGWSGGGGGFGGFGGGSSGGGGASGSW